MDRTVVLPVLMRLTKLNILRQSTQFSRQKSERLEILIRWAAEDLVGNGFRPLLDDLCIVAIFGTNCYFSEMANTRIRMGMDGPALLGLPTCYLTDEANVRMGKWVGAVPGYEEVVRKPGYIEVLRSRLHEWRCSS